MRAIWGDGELSILQKPPPNILLGRGTFFFFLELLIGRREVISVNHWDRGSESSPFLNVCRLVFRLFTPYDLPLEVTLFSNLGDY